MVRNMGHCSCGHSDARSATHGRFCPAGFVGADHLRPRFYVALPSCREKHSAEYIPAMVSVPSGTIRFRGFLDLYRHLASQQARVQWHNAVDDLRFGK